MHEIGLLLLIEQQRRAYEACNSQTISYIKVFEFIFFVLWVEKTRAKCSAKPTAGHFVKYITHCFSECAADCCISLFLFFFSFSRYSLFLCILYLSIFSFVFFRFTGESGLVPVRGAENKYIVMNKTQSHLEM